MFLNKSLTILLELLMPVTIGVLLFINLGTFPNTLYNWESYTVWSYYQIEFNEQEHSIQSYLQPIDGLMTDSGFSLVVGLPIHLLLSIFGNSLVILRIWTATLTLIGVFLYYLLISKIFGRSIGVLALLLLCSSQAFLLYSRTATNVAPTLLIEIIIVFLIYRGLIKTFSLKLVILSLSVLFLSYYFYAPIRFFTPLLIFCILKWVLLLVSKSIKNNKIKRFINAYEPIILAGISLLVGIAVMWLAQDSLLSYYNGRGEHVLNTVKTESFSPSLLKTIKDQTLSNIQSYLQLIFAISSKPVITDYWNHSGQIVNLWLVPFLILGVVFSFGKSIKKDQKYMLLLFWFLITSVPMIFTSNVHAGRLFLSFAPLYVIIATGIVKPVRFILSSQKRTIQANFKPMRFVLYLLMAVFCFFVAYQEITAYFAGKPTLENNIKILLDNQSSYLSKTVYLINANSSTLRFWETFFFLRENVFFLDKDTLVSPDNNRLPGQITEGWLIRNPITEYSMSRICDSSQNALILVGNEISSNTTATLLECRATVLRLSQ